MGQKQDTKIEGGVGEKGGRKKGENGGRNTVRTFPPRGSGFILLAVLGHGSSLCGNAFSGSRSNSPA
jgi:hypothetical protein